MHMNDEPLLTMVEAAEFLKLSIGRIRYEVYLKRIPNYKIGRSIRFSKKALNKWLEGLERKGPNDY